jgi:hypothetical protein
MYFSLPDIWVIESQYVGRLQPFYAAIRLWLVPATVWRQRRTKRLEDAMRMEVRVRFRAGQPLDLMRQRRRCRSAHPPSWIHPNSGGM